MAEMVKRMSTAAKPTAEKPRKTATKKKTDVSNVTQMTISHDQVAQLAHRFWAERGHRDGHHVEDWLRAEEELRKKAS